MLDASGNRGSSQHYQDELIQRIAADSSLSTPILNAFKAVPRHSFLSEFYRKEPSSAGDSPSVWKHYTGPEALPLVYQDIPLVTKFDQYHIPISSSSQPGLMAWMLEVLAIRPGMRVLEIGTGTGYNAALLAHLVGEPALVTSVEIDPALAEQARPAIERCVGPGVTIITGDGLLGYLPHAPYDRIIATGSFNTVPQPWLDQLVDGGLLLLNLQRSLLDAMLLLQKESNGRGTGTFLASQARFMRLHHGTGAYQKPQVPLGPLEPVIEQAQAPEFRQKDLAFFIQCQFPDADHRVISQKSARFTYLHDVPKARIIQFWNGEVRGSRELWQELQGAVHAWSVLGHPQRHEYTFEVLQVGDMLHHIIALGDHRWRLV